MAPTLGGFDVGFSYALDWDMWKRVAIRYPIWYHPEPLACYRMHASSETARLRPDGSHLVEIFRSIDHSAALLSPVVAGRVVRRARFHYAVFVVENALEAIRSGGAWAAALLYLRIARQESSTPTVIAALIKVALRGARRTLTRVRKNR